MAGPRKRIARFLRPTKEQFVVFVLADGVFLYWFLFKLKALCLQRGGSTECSPLLSDVSQIPNLFSGGIGPQHAYFVDDILAGVVIIAVISSIVFYLLSQFIFLIYSHVRTNTQTER